MKLIYVAGAYTSNPSKNMEIAEKASIELIRNGFAVFTPHKNFYDYQKYEDVDYETYLQIDFEIISRCNAVYVLDNWNESPGTKREIEYCDSIGIPVLYQSVSNACDLLPDNVPEKKEEEILSKAIAHYGEPAQVLKCIEELCELGLALTSTLSADNQYFIESMVQLADRLRDGIDIVKYEVPATTSEIRLYTGNSHTIREVISELVDVEITTKQIRKILTTEEEFKDAKDFKLNRLKERIVDNELKTWLADKGDSAIAEDLSEHNLRTITITPPERITCPKCDIGMLFVESDFKETKEFDVRCSNGHLFRVVKGDSK